MTPGILAILDDQTIGSVVCALRVAQWGVQLPDWNRDFSATTPDAVPFAIGLARKEIADTVADDGSVSEIERKVDAIVEAIGLTGIGQRINALDYAELNHGGDATLRDDIARQLQRAIRQLLDAASSRAGRRRPTPDPRPDHHHHRSLSHDTTRSPPSRS
jgi:hypothetical protein